MTSTNLLNRQIIGNYRRNRISLNSIIPHSDQTIPETNDQSIIPTSPKRKLNSPIQPSKQTSTTNPTQTATTSHQPTKRTKQSSTSRPSTNTTSLIKPITSNVTLSDLGGIDSTVEKILELIALPILHPEIFEFAGLKPIRGLLLCGPPGCGKTMLASAISNQLGITLINVSSTSIVSGMSGESEKAIRDIFDQATKQAPCLLFIDEIDAITPKRETAQREMERRIVAQLLTCLDDLSLEKTDGKPVIVIGATNRPDSLDPALRRGGRFDHEILMGVPDERAREQILRVLCEKLKLVEAFDFKKLARATPGYVGADLTALTASAGVIAIKRIFETSMDTEDTVMIDEQEALDGDVIPETEGIQIEPTPQNPAPSSSSDPFGNLPENLLSLPIINFLRKNPQKLTPDQLERIRISQTDFHQALKDFQPSCKREGFSTIPDTTWSQIGAMKSVRDELNISIIQPIRFPEMFEKLGIASSFGILLWGPPGCGKTLLAKAVANESQANFISVKGPELLNKYVGESEKAVRQVFVRARASAPCIIFFDELDALVPRRDDSLSESSSRVVNTLLTELDGLESRKQIFVIGATNRPDVMDPAMVRPGRLDKMIFVDLPDPIERWEIFSTLSHHLRIQEIDQIKVLVKEKCNGYSGADVGALIREASLIGLRQRINSNSSVSNNDDDQPIILGLQDFNEALKKVRASVSIGQQKRYRAMHQRFNGVPAGIKGQDEDLSTVQSVSHQPNHGVAMC
ncbi:AAA ATPase [Melampsora larici-populina 98AG31]|uniref:AAA ATPase n=1 Tax=Melampsora larici-populina (strain 98AG31 / pathotype 3-4-7) TaxID=747676 RepID=F4S5K3_MELLP|nr:AAA ATPase [Melampsora larici-populina 98AG31]EGG00041.1 AAA ATPase [Melampsora larici-populina 98AG31]